MALAKSASRWTVLRGLRPVRGSRWLVVARWMIHMLAATPLLIAAAIGAADLGRRPYFTDGDGPLSLVQLLRLMDTVPSAALLAALVTSALLFILAEQVLTAGAAAWLAPGLDRDAAGRQATFIARQGVVPLLVFLRLLVVALLLIVAGSLAIGVAFSRLAIYGEVAGWSGRVLMLELPLLKAATFVLWAALVGSFAFWCRLVTVADRRRLLRRTALVVLGVLRRHPLRSAGLFVVVTTALAALSAGVLLLWRQQAPRGAGLLLWVGLWSLVLLVKAMAWHWLIHAGRLLYAGDDLEQLRRTVDAPLRPLRWLRLTLRLYSRRVG